MKRGGVTEGCAFITSDRRITVYGCDGIEKYTDTEMVLCLKELTLSVIGQGLAFSSFACGEIEITGRIVSVEYKRNGRGKEC